MCRSVRVLCVLCMLAVACSGAARAQTNAIDEVRSNARTHVGPIYITPAILLRELGVDTNVFNQAVDPKTDFMFTVVPQADVAIPISHRLLLQAPMAAELVYYQKYSSERSVNPRIAPRAELFLNKVSVFAGGSYLRTRQRPNNEIDTRSRRTERSLGGGIAYRYSPKLSFVAGAERADVKYDAQEEYLNVSLQQTLNRDSILFNASTRYAVTALTTIVLRADTSQDRFQYSPQRNADTWRVMPGVEFSRRALITGKAFFGMRTFRTKNIDLEDFKGLVGSLALGYTLAGRTLFFGTVDRDLAYSYEPQQPYYLMTSYGLTVRHRLPGKFDITGGAARYHYTYRNLLSPDAGGPAFERLDITRNYTASVGYMLGPDLRLGVGTSYWDRESNWAAYRNYNGFRTGLSLSYGF